MQAIPPWRPYSRIVRSGSRQAEDGRTLNYFAPGLRLTEAFQHGVTSKFGSDAEGRWVVTLSWYRSRNSGWYATGGRSTIGRSTHSANLRCSDQRLTACASDWVSSSMEVPLTGAIIAIELNPKIRILELSCLLKEASATECAGGVVSRQNGVMVPTKQHRRQQQSYP